MMNKNNKDGSVSNKEKKFFDDKGRVVEAGFPHRLTTKPAEGNSSIRPLEGNGYLNFAQTKSPETVIREQSLSGDNSDQTPKSKFSFSSALKFLVGLFSPSTFNKKFNEQQSRENLKSMTAVQNLLNADLRKSQHDKNKDLQVTPPMSDEDHTIVEIDGVMHVITKR
jgi:hypothetical protein